MKRITDPTFRYHSSADTDVARTFARVRREMKKQAEADAAAKAASKVAPINARRSAAQ